MSAGLESLLRTEEQEESNIVQFPKTKVAEAVEKETSPYSYLFAGLGALGTAIQNYQAIAALANGGRLLQIWMQALAIGAGGLCSGLINYGVNLELLEDFRKRMTSEQESLVKRLNLNAWQQLQYYAGLFVFVVTGILFGLMAFTFAMSGPLGLVSIAIGVFVAGVMTIQEVETWLQSYETPEEDTEELTQSQTVGKWVGHIIAAGNVLALSLLFTLSLAQALLICNVALVPAIIAGFTVAFSFGAFTEFYFYDHHLAKFCSQFDQKLQKLNETSCGKLGLFCAVTNGLVNSALTYVGVMMLSTLLISAHIFLPPLAIVTTLAVISALFAGAASFTLGVDFWIRTFSKESKDNKQEINNDLCEQAETKSDEAKSVSKSSSFATSFCGLFGKSHKKALIDKSATAANSQQVDRASGSFSKAG